MAAMAAQPPNYFYATARPAFQNTVSRQPASAALTAGGAAPIEQTYRPWST